MTNEPEPNTRAGEALPCPWCSGKGFAQSPSLGHSSWRVVCDDCCAEGPTVPSYNVDDPEAFCIIAWNNRAGNVALPTWDHYAEEHVDTRPLPQPSELVETPEAFNKKKERCLAYVEQHWKWGNLTRLGIVNQLVRDGFRQTWAIEQADRIAPAANQAVAHITQLEAQIAKLQADGDKLAGAATALRDDMLMRAEMHKHRNNGELVVEAGNGVWRRINAALTEWKDRA